MYFSDVFGVSSELLADENLFDISLVSDLPLFIDPFLIFDSERPEYQSLHDSIIRYMSFVRDKSVARQLTNGERRHWLHFPEISNNWLGFSIGTNRGRGLGDKFARGAVLGLTGPVKDFGEENFSDGSHVERLFLFSDGTRTIITPYFNYSISVSLDPDDSTSVIWRREVDAIKEPDSIFSEQFADVFGSEFDTVEFSLPTSIDLDELIDQIEALDDESLTVSFDMNATNCYLSVDGVNGQIEVTSDTLSIVKSRPTEPKLILESFFEIQKALIDTHGVRAITFDGAPTS